MTVAPALERLAALVADAFGLEVTATGRDLLAAAVQRRMAALGTIDPAAYIGHLEHAPPHDEELRIVAGLLTIGETSFFRTRPQLDAFVGEALPARLTVPGDVTILSAGCSTGEEAYTLAMLVREQVRVSDARRVRILALDLDGQAIAHARLGRYSAWSLRETSEVLRERWFRAEGSEFVLDPSIRNMVEFRVVNLLAEDPLLWRPAAFDIAFCRNVTIYFTPQAVRALTARLIGSLAPGGYLFIGHAESMRGVSDALELRHAHGAFFYRKPQAVPAESRPAAPPRSPAGDAPPPDRETQVAVDLLRQERFTEAEAATRAGAAAADAATGLLLARAIALMNLDAAAREQASGLCRRILAAAPGVADAYLLEAVLCEQAAADDAATRAYAAALSRDTGCAMAHLGLARIAQRRDDRPRALGAYQAALRLLPAESDTRLVLFAGGFSRDLLMQLCRSEIDGVTTIRPAVRT